MRTLSKVLLWGSLAAAALVLSSCQAGILNVRPEKVEIVVVTDDSGFDRDAFLTLFTDYDDIRFTEVHGPARDALLETLSHRRYDVIVLYDVEPLSSRQQANLEASVRGKGVGLVVLGPMIAEIGDTEVCRGLVGASVADGSRTALHEGRLLVHVIDPNHPITRLMSDFEMDDSVVSGLKLAPDATILLKPAQPSAETPIGWTHAYGQGRVCVLQGGSSPEAWSNIYYRALVVRAIRWSAGVLR